MRRLRMRLARWVAPAPITWDPFPAVTDGVILTIREGGYTAAYKVDKFRMKSRLVLRPRVWNADLEHVFGDTHRTLTTFVGTVGR